ncbi:hypothetical protein ACFQU2_22130 [Siccirubricoccus deserti]
MREAEAPPEIAALYAALRQASGVPLVNLIHRHLATLPGVLPWVWQAIRPPLETGTLAAARLRLAAALPAPPAPLPAADWAAAGLAPEQRATIRALVEVYDRGNLTNLILLTALRRTLEGEPLAAVAPPAAIAPPPMLPAPLPLPRLEALAPPVAALVRGLAARHGEAGWCRASTSTLPIGQSCWRRCPLARPRLAPEALAAGRAAAVRLAEAEADALRPALDIRGAVPGGQAPAVLAALGTFTRQVIPGMVPLGLILAGLLEPFHAD